MNRRATCFSSMADGVMASMISCTSRLRSSADQN
jgi:hypothetical protein